jgi:hypothetical protein
MDLGCVDMDLPGHDHHVTVVVLADCPIPDVCHGRLLAFCLSYCQRRRQNPGSDPIHRIARWRDVGSHASPERVRLLQREAGWLIGLEQ